MNNKTHCLDCVSIVYNIRNLGTRVPFLVEKILLLTIVFLHSPLIMHIACCDTEEQAVEG